MEESSQHNEKARGPFSPLQTGCAFVMLTNMLIYLAVLAFVLNLLDPSKLDPSYLAKRRFTAEPEQESPTDRAFRQLSEEKRETRQKAQEEILDNSRYAASKEPSAAVRLSEMAERSLADNQPNSLDFPRAALTRSTHSGGASYTHSAKSRLFSVSIYPQASLRNTYSPYRLPTAKTIEPEPYETLPLEMATGITFPKFSLPESERSSAYLYKPQKAVPDSSVGGPRIQAPSGSTGSILTNVSEKPEINEEIKDDL